MTYYNKYTFALSHDKGSCKISTVAQSEDAAIKSIMLTERCPKQSLTLIKTRALYSY